MEHYKTITADPKPLARSDDQIQLMQQPLEAIRLQHDLACIIMIDAEGTLIAQVGDHPEGEEFALYSPMVMETTRTMARCGGFGEPLCNGVILKGGRILITYQEVVNGRVIYLSLLCRKRVPDNLLSLLQRITALLDEEA